MGQQGSAVTVPIQVAEATSSSSYNNDFLPDFAIDGFPPNQDIGNSNGFHSAQEDYPWFQLNLGSPQTVTGVLILNRINCCGERLKNLEIRAGMTPVDAGFRGKLAVNKKVGEFAGPGVTGETYTIEFDEEVTAQYITLQLTDPNSILQINEIKVFREVNHVQVAPADVKISSSHTCSTGQCGPGKAEYCADDVGTTICHTRHGADNFPWIALEFSAPVQVTKVEILNAQSQWERIGTVDVRITESLPTDGKTMFSGGDLFGRFSGPGTTGGVVTLEETPKQGTYVLIQRNKGQFPNEVLIVSDIRVFTSSLVNDEQTSGECAEGWSSYGESCYHLYGTQEQLTWAEAQAECQKQNSNLAIARDENVVLFLGGLQGTNRIWLGAQRQPGSDPAVGYTLVDGSPLSSQNWRQGEPTGGNELCLEQYSQQHQLKWNDVPIQVAKATSSSSYNNDFLPDF